VGTVNVEEKMLAEVNKNVEKCPDTIFDTFDLSIDRRKFGAALRDTLVDLANQYGRINQLAANSKFKHGQAKKKLEEVTALAWAKFRPDKDMKVTEKKIRVKEFEVMYNGEKTSIDEEEKNVLIYEYMEQRGKNKMEEMSTILDVGRTLMSWDKQEYSRSNS